MRPSILSLTHSRHSHSFLYIFDACMRAIVIMIELVKRPKIIAERQSPCVCISNQAVQHCVGTLDIIVSKSGCMLTFRIHIPPWKRCFGALAFWLVRHAQLIQHSNAANAPRQSVRRCQALVATLQRHLRIHRPRIPFILCGSSVLQDMVPEQLVPRAREQRPHRSIQLGTSVQS